MKSKILLVLLPLFLLISCDKGKINKLNEQVARLQHQNEQLSSENAEIKTYVEEISKLLESVESDLDKINEVEIDIRKMTEAAGLSKVESDVRTKLGLIGQHILDSREKISELEKQISASRHNLKGVKSLMANLKTKLETKENEIATLMQEIGILETDITKLGNEIKEKDIRIVDQESIIEEQNRRYYIFDKEKALKEKGIIKKEGGFLFFGKVTKMSPNLDTEHFNVIDSESDFEISISHKTNKIKIISPHQVDSYELTGDENQTTLKILDAGQFWKATRCLVMVVK